MAQQSPVPSADVPQPPPSAQQDDPDDDWDWRRWPDRMREWMTGEDDWHPGNMVGWGGGRGSGMMWGGGLPMMMAMMDTDENGSISYEEAVHRRMFNLVDKDKNGDFRRRKSKK